MENAPSHSFFHVATHGFFEADPCLAAGKHQDAYLRDPLARCGLVLAGANLRQRSQNGSDDGLLTGAEIAAMDLTTCECVLLSSCSSAFGDAGHTEGIFGLQRACRLTGARSLVMDVCPVDDEAARLWMREFYRFRLATRGRTNAAARSASR